MSLYTHIYGKLFCTIEPKTPRHCKDDSDCSLGKFCKPSKLPFVLGTCEQIRMPNKPKACWDDSDCSAGKFCKPSKRPYGKGTCVQINLPNKHCMDDSDCAPEEICYKDLVPFGVGLCKPRRVKPGKLWNL